MLEYQNDKRYIIYYNLKNSNYRKLGPYRPGMLPEIYNSDGTERYIQAIPAPDEQIQDYCKNLPIKFIGFIDHKYRNMNLKDIRFSSNLRAKIMCLNCKNTWEVIVNHITKSGSLCPYCNRQSISFPEKYIYYCLKQINSNLQENFKISGTKMEYDMYDPASRIAIEFNGPYHNKDSTDDKKLQLAINNNINLIRVWQYRRGKKLDLTDKNNYIIPDNSSINNVPYLDIIINDICMQYEADYQKINKQWAQDQAFLRTNKTPPAGESLLDQYPDICRDWDYTKNRVIRPEMIYPSQGIKVHWKCFYCHREWETSPNRRTASNTRQKSGCQSCNIKIGKGTLKEMPYIPGK